MALTASGLKSDLTALLGTPTTDADGETAWQPHGATLQSLLTKSGLPSPAEILKSAPKGLGDALDSLSLTEVVLSADGDAYTLSVKVTAGDFELSDICSVSAEHDVEFVGPWFSVTWAGGADVSVTLDTGSVHFAGAKLALDVQVTLPALLVSASLESLPSGTASTLGDALQVTGMGAGKTPTLKSLDVAAALRIPSFSMRLDVENLLDLGGLEVQETVLGATLRQVQAAQTSGWQLGLSARARLAIELPAYDPLPAGELLVDIAAEKHPSGGWSVAGGLAPDTEVSIGQLVNGLANKLGEDGDELPAFLGDILLERLFASYDTQAGSTVMTFTCGVALHVGPGGLSLDLALDVKLTNSGTGWSRSFGGRLSLGTHVFEIDLLSQKDGVTAAQLSILVARYKESAKLDLGELVAGVPALEGVLDGVKLDLQSARLARFTETGKPARLLGGIGIGLDDALDLHSLPLVGEMLPAGGYSINSLRFVVASAPVLVEELDKFEEEDKTFFALSPAGTSGVTSTTVAIEPGLSVRASLTLGGQPVEFPTPPRTSAPPDMPGLPGGKQPAPPASNAAVASAPGAWLDVSQTFGPITIDRIGANYQGSKAWFMLDGGLKLGVLELKAEGLGIGVNPQGIPQGDITKLEPSLHIRGFSLSYSAGPVVMSGGFIADETMELYAGELQVQAVIFGLSAIGMYGTVPDHTGNWDYKTAFIFAMVSAPLGGPAPVLVTGLAGGFGYNSKVELPTLATLNDHLLVQAVRPPGPGQAANPLANNSGPSDVLGKLLSTANGTPATVHPEQGEKWLAAGLRVTVAELIQATALLVVELGVELELGIIGLASVALPPPAPGGEEEGPVFAFVELAMSVAVLPAEGIFRAAALVTPASFVLDPACRLTGGFAFYTWFGDNPHAGDFVITVGGYHPDYQVPSHYPVVPRLGFHWAVSDVLSMRGEAFFALTPSAVMAGGLLDAQFHAGPIRAWFIAMMKALIEWAPFHFAVKFQISIGVAFSFRVLGLSITLKVELGAILQIWGPPIGGIAHISYYIISFSIPFGADENPKTRLKWDEFSKKLLQADEAHRITIRATAGLQAKPESAPDDLWIVRADDLRITVGSTIPVLRVQDTQDTSQEIYKGQVGITIRPMGATLTDSLMSFTLTNLDTGEKLRLRDHMEWETYEGQVPAAVWGGLVPDDKPLTFDSARAKDGGEMVTCTLGLQALRARAPAALTPSDLQSLRLATLLRDENIGTGTVAPFAAPLGLATTAAADRDSAMTRIQQLCSGNGAARAALLADLGAYGLSPCSAAEAQGDAFAGKPDLWLSGAPIFTSPST